MEIMTSMYVTWVNINHTFSFSPYVLIADFGRRLSPADKMD